MHRSHVAQFSLTIVSDETLRFACRAEAGGSEWAYVGPFAFTEKEMDGIRAHMDFPRVVYSKKISKSATVDEREKIWSQFPTLDFMQKDFFQEMRTEDIFKTHVFGLAYAEEKCGKTGDAKIEKPEALLSDNAEWATLHPASKPGDDVRLLLDFGKEIIGFHLFEVDAEPGLVLDFHNFEFIQADGRHNLANGMNNSFRYICNGGRERFQSRERRGFQYSWLIARNMTRPLRIREVSVVFSTYPQTHAGSFTSSDELLNTIWKVGAHTLRLCAEDTYTDCPSYEQTHWVGDARNEALVDYVVNGDHRLWFHCLLQTGQSLERLPITISQAASAWDNLLPAWSFLWMRSCREYLLWTGDEKG
ncbi:MAG: family 78 glycoside hydrolase catalytic domain, partial [Spirochaetia bacterium]|nr:family 78 glycoside hydrolase catalytic domain [Spirochaetia bacterium]